MSYITLIKLVSTLVITSILAHNGYAQSPKRARDWGIHIGVIKTGYLNSITDVNGISVGHTTIKKGDSVNTGVTVIVPHQGNVFQQKVPAAVYTGNGFGKLAGSTQINELGNIETPIVLTNTLSVPAAMSGLITYTLAQAGNEKISSVNGIVGETNDGYLNDIRGRHVTEQDVLIAIESATTNKVIEGAIGAGTGTVCFGFKGGIGTASRKLPSSLGGYTIGVLVQSNFGGVLTIDGVAAGEYLQKFSFSNELLNNVDGSCMIIVATDAPLDHRNLMRLAKRAMLGLGRTGGIASNGSGDYVIAFSTAEQNRVMHQTNNLPKPILNLPNDAISPIFMAAIEATEEAIINSLITATDTKGFRGNKVSALPIQQLVPLFTKEKK
ncbi:MAG: aminopeptidase [Sphingobacteriia bacterium 24-36-13]|jgi:D-aminopeptidase|uniref:DmpA family aminopeptidase n=1 Tax=Sediminibacterium sp. TaxID=1917865 RepID=UPI000BC6A9DA|nr:P1 family peptidase [Sediminibacterium sp.]OYY08092.1 MAG: aminopeptidase [Sphingobacteriia bacterium 35-36-14]OYZ55020.1 MAG: aminopeptidase [Sphingobacteriia bacterium 24-36-13]OZA66452.1 MAG: aminopeptidase [Sphingobacteriia bacterium 39-36-14]HQS23041.1 P1 family peptidase [Sediminibacterium sp.]HQS33837.1 P1 family peptidase [Sediminibacterium sp.]